MPKDESLMGKSVKVRIVSSSKFSVVGEVVKVTSLQHRESHLAAVRSSTGVSPLFTRSSVYSALAVLILVIARFIWIFLWRSKSSNDLKTESKYPYRYFVEIYYFVSSQDSTWVDLRTWLPNQNDTLFPVTWVHVACRWKDPFFHVIWNSQTK